MNHANWVEDHLMITDLIHEYSRSIDDNSPTRVAALFTEDCTFKTYEGGSGTAHGSDQVAERCAKLLATFDATSHHVSNIQIKFEGPHRATGVTYVYAWHRFVGERPDGYLWARYHDVYVKSDAGWLIAERTLRVSGEHDFPFHWIGRLSEG